ncbi:hypothetical protein WJX84_007175 [Apatococcus fuscideae]|uniref:G-patch domain-containing protein n=1 Tax=Apatococcus fuscideae TaxID=2026836 RepID=A0AAW1SKP0_9CHLO
MPVVQRTSKKLWLPSEQDRERLDQESKQAQEAARQTEDTDELDALLDAYDKAAQADKQAVERTRKEEKKPASMKELRAEGLANPLTAENRGFQLLSKMGYQPGQGLGKGAVGAAIPIAVEIKSKRTGLGIDEAQKERQSQQLQMQQLRAAKRQKHQEVKQTDFRGGQAAAATNRRLEGQLRQASRTCEDLDRRAGMTASPMWPVEPKPDEDAEGSDDEAEIQLDPAMAAFQELPLPERLQQTFSHLRETHRYCLFCGHQYGSQSDLPGTCTSLRRASWSRYNTTTQLPVSSNLKSLGLRTRVA